MSFPREAPMVDLGSPCLFDYGYHGERHSVARSRAHLALSSRKLRVAPKRATEWGLWTAILRGVQTATLEQAMETSEKPLSYSAPTG